MSGEGRFFTPLTCFAIRMAVVGLLIIFAATPELDMSGAYAFAYFAYAIVMWKVEEIEERLDAYGDLLQTLADSEKARLDRELHREQAMGRTLERLNASLRRETNPHPEAPAERASKDEAASPA